MEKPTQCPAEGKLAQKPKTMKVTELKARISAAVRPLQISSARYLALGGHPIRRQWMKDQGLPWGAQAEDYLKCRLRVKLSLGC